MMRKLILAREAKKFIEKLSLDKHKNQIANKLILLKTNPRPNDSKKLSYYNYYRCDIGEYRIIYNFNDEHVYILVIGHRNDNDVYKRLRRLHN